MPQSKINQHFPKVLYSSPEEAKKDYDNLTSEFLKVFTKVIIEDFENSKIPPFNNPGFKSGGYSSQAYESQESYIKRREFCMPRPNESYAKFKKRMTPETEDIEYEEVKPLELPEHGKEEEGK